jgi:hypothetical protein
MPAARLFCAFDVDPLTLGGIVTGDNSTCESLGDWTAGANTVLDLNDAVARVHAGTHSLRLTATAAGDISVSLPGIGAGTVTAGRRYVTWAHSRPEETARTVAVSQAWTTAGGGALTPTSANVGQVYGSYVEVGVLGVAPASSGKLNLTVTVQGCAAGEVHYVDVVTMDYVGEEITDKVLSWSVSLAGRNHELDRTDSGSATYVLDNADGRFTPGRDATTLAPYAGNILPRRRLFHVAFWNSVLYPVWSGYSRRWVQQDVRTDRWSTVQLSADDGYRWLTGVDVPAAYRAEVLSDSPVTFFPLGEPSSTTFAGDIVSGQSAELLFAQDGAGDSAFGADTVLPVQSTGTNTDGGSTALAINVLDELGTQGAALDLRGAAGLVPDRATGWTVEFWFAYEGPISPVVEQVLFTQRIFNFPGDDDSGFSFVLTTSGTVEARTTAGDTIGSSGFSVLLGGSHHLALTYGAGGTFGTAVFYANGAPAATLVLTGEPLTFGAPQTATLGGAFNTAARQASFPTAGRFSHLAFYAAVLSADRVAAHHTAGRTGFAAETDGDRVAALLRLAGWPAEDTAIDAGLTTLVSRDWSGGNALALAQDAAAYGGSTPVMDARGAFKVLNRHRVVNEVPYLAYYSGSGSTNPDVDDYSPWIDDSRIENVIEVDAGGGPNVVVTDADSIARYGRIKGETVDSRAAFTSEPAIFARWRIGRTAEPARRIDVMTWRPDAGDGTLWPLILPRRYGDRILIGELPDPAVDGALSAPVSEAVTPLVTGPGGEYDALIGRVAHAGDGTSWKTRFTLEPAIIDLMGVCDHPVYGIADTPACVAGY